MHLNPTLCLLPLLFPLAAYPQYQLQTVASGLTQPVALSHAGDARSFIVERAGRIKIMRPNGTVDAQLFLDITDRVLSNSGEQGLLGLAFPSDHASSGRFYVYYTYGTGNGVVRLSRFTTGADPDVANAASEEVLWQTAKPATNHNGGCVRFGPDGYLYIAPGDGGGTGDPWNNAQNMATGLGKMLRFDVAGEGAPAVPATNPFVDVQGVLPEIWASGLRNPWRFAFDRANGDLWIADVGQDQQEEIHRWPSGDNSGPDFGWRCYEGTAAYNTTGCGPATDHVPPVHVHPHSDGSCSITGGVLYRGTAFPGLQGRYVYTDLCHGRVHALHDDDGDWAVSTLMNSGAGGTVSVDEDAAGEVYFVRMNAGTIHRLVDASQSVQVAARIFLAGAYVEADGLMRDALRTEDLLPITEPYAQLGYAPIANAGNEQIATGVLDVSGPNAIVDWVRVELRAAAQPAVVLASRNGLLQRDGDVVATDGTSALSFTIGQGSHYVAVRHRNHLGAMTATPVTIGTTPALVDLTTPALAAWGTEARMPIAGVLALWPGNTVPDGKLAYTGPGNDRDPILQAIGGTVPTQIITGYLTTDVDLNGTVQYTGLGNDRDRILQAIGGVVPTHTLGEELP